MSALALAEKRRSTASWAIPREVRPTEPTKQYVESPALELWPNAESLLESGSRPRGDSPEDILSALIRECLQDSADPYVEAAKLLARFGSLGGVLYASEHELRRVIRKSEELHYIFVTVRKAAFEIARSTIDLRPVISTSAEFASFARAKIGHETQLVCCAIYLNPNMRVIEVEEHSRGTTDHVVFYPREICLGALKKTCSNVVLMRNTLMDEVDLSVEDVSSIAKLCAQLNLISVTLHDYIIVNSKSAVSSRGLGLLGDLI